jgi:predicted neutral ceramidase superfamily lipid hydrolase
MNLSTVLLIIFIVLKLTGVIAWSWLWVLSPLWISLLLALLLLGLAFAFFGVAGLRRISGRSLGRRGSKI